jgi:hypothetical protein
MTGAQIDALTHGVQYQGVSVTDPVAAPWAGIYSLMFQNLGAFSITRG